MVELVDTLDLGSSVERLGGSSPFARTTQRKPPYLGGFLGLINKFADKIRLLHTIIANKNRHEYYKKSD